MKSEIENNKCLFCKIYEHKSEEILFKNKFWFCLYDLNPVNVGHVVVIPVEHHEDIFSLNTMHYISLEDAVNSIKKILDTKFKPDGYNIGINCGESAGQTIFHLHIHIIPRYKGDVDEPRGGIRNFKKPLREYAK
jgi:diadenosine tetraphosphate (Ap4A) HIT family hydrolase